MDIVLIKSFSDKPWRSVETFQLIENSLKEKWTVFSIATTNPEELHKFIDGISRQSGEKVFVFNISEYLNEDSKQGFIPGLLDEWNLPHLGSSAEVIAAGLDKQKTKMILVDNQISTPRFFIADKFGRDYSVEAEKIGFPLFVKPLNEGGHIGIGEHSIVRNPVSLDKEIINILKTFEVPAMVEEYIRGSEMREFSVGIIDGEDKLFTPVEIDYQSMQLNTRILSFESAEKDLEMIKLVDDNEVEKALVDLTEKTFNAMGARDYSRVDIRMNERDLYVLEINVMPGLGPHSFLPEAAKSIHGMDYSQLIQRLAEVALKRK